MHFVSRSLWVCVSLSQHARVCVCVCATVSGSMCVRVCVLESMKGPWPSNHKAWSMLQISKARQSYDQEVVLLGWEPVRGAGPPWSGYSVSFISTPASSSSWSTSRPSMFRVSCFVTFAFWVGGGSAESDGDRTNGSQKSGSGRSGLSLVAGNMKF